MKRVMYVWVLMMMAIAADAQQPGVTIRLVNKKNEPVPYGSYTITSRLDTTIVISKTGDSLGTIKVPLETGQTYSVKITAEGYAVVEKGIKINTGSEVFTYRTDPQFKDLQVVSVQSVRIPVKQEDDKTIVDVESLGSSTTDGFDVVEKTPGLFVDQDGNVYLNSTTPATILINGRNTRMSAADMAAMLRSLPPGTISKIEIIRTPSASVDAATSGGVVNLVLKKGVKVGLNGSVSAGITQGVYGNQFAGMSLTNNTGKVNSYINTQYTRRDNYNEIEFRRFFNADSVISQNSFIRTPGTSFFAGAGISGQVSRKWELSADARVTLNGNDSRNYSTSQVYRQTPATTLYDLRAVTDDDARNNVLSANITAKYRNDSAGTEWVTDVFGSRITNDITQQYTSRFQVPAVFTERGFGDNNTVSNLLVLQSDYRKKTKSGFQLEAGVKFSNLRFTGSNLYFFDNNGVPLKDGFRTNSYTYTERISAAYAQGTRNFSGFVVKAGLRFENTDMKGNPISPKDTVFSIRRSDLFPYLYLSRKLMTVGGYPVKAFVIYRKSVTRPDYSFLNPAPRYIDPYYYEVGNPSLRPQFTHNVEANISVEDVPMLAVGLNRTSDIFSGVIYQADSNRASAYRTYENIGSNREFYFRVTGLIPPQGRFFFLVGAQYNNTFYEGVYEGQPIAFRRGSWSLFTNERFRIDKYSTIYMNAFVRINGLQQFYELGNFGFLNLSVNRQFLKKKLTVTLSASDVLFSNNYRFTLNQGTVNADGYRESDTRRFGINIRYNFGIRKKEEPSKFSDVVQPDKPEAQ